MNVTKRDGRIVPFDINKIISAITKAFEALDYDVDEETVIDIASEVEIWDEITIEEIQDQVEELLMDWDFKDVAKEYINYRARQAERREQKTKGIFRGIINTENNDVTRENANMNSDSPAGMMMKFASETTKPFVDSELLSKDVKEAVENNYIHIHDKDYYPTRSLTCLQHPLDRILSNGFKAGHGEARGAKRIETASILAAISMETIQNEMHGGQAIPAFDFYMAPYVRATFNEELAKISELLGIDFPNNVEVYDYIYAELSDEVLGNDRVIQHAINQTVKRVHQAMESFIHNMNAIHSRGGNQVVFSSINYGTDTSAEGRCIIRELLLSTEKGVGNGATAIFPIQIWKLKAGVSRNPGDPNFDLYKLSCRVSAKRFFPNYLNLDATFNQDSAWDVNDPKRYEHEVATMGCRTRVFENRFGPQTSVGRGNLSFTTINLPKIALEASTFNEFLKNVEYYTRLAGKQLHERFQFQAEATAKQFPLLMSGMWNGSENLNPDDLVASVLNQGTLGIGFIGLAEALIAINGKHHGESEESQQLGLKTITMMRDIANELSEQYQHNYSILATPAEGLSGKFTKKDKETFGIIPGITDKDYYTNSNHVPVYYQCSAKHKAEVEGPYHELTRGGHIFYVEIDGDATKNPLVIMDIVDKACANNCGYISVNHFQGRCPICNYETADKEITECPHCHQPLDILQRITGYLVGTTNRWNSGKLAELRDRVQHS